MFLKRFALRVLTLCPTADVTYSVWSHCHNTESCENRTSHLVFGMSGQNRTTIKWTIT